MALWASDSTSRPPSRRASGAKATASGKIGLQDFDWTGWQAGVRVFTSGVASVLAGFGCDHFVALGDLAADPDVRVVPLDGTDDLSRLRELHARYFAEMRSIIANSEPVERVVVSTSQRFALDAETDGALSSEGPK